ncbi:hypothetical protein STIV2_B71 [Sulfolobus turreted icosahedral virus 2]|uniref:Uncharacterized protein n=1 Tax=Sulfolobus turreted icosahedral virus 2 TaxID=754004 RepID=D5IEY7_9VIRU|nr:hypothetical protein STIV2_B71 [Sulfolobus turreted icosahedral virus 2]ADF27759.1 hypothetical protein STIV2_B71 [Sulfolobus turreted icosahedral virus 2]
MRKINIYKCYCGYTTYDYLQLLQHYTKHIEEQIEQLKKEIEEDREKGLIQRKSVKDIIKEALGFERYNKTR